MVRQFSGFLVDGFHQTSSMAIAATLAPTTWELSWWSILLRSGLRVSRLKPISNWARLARCYRCLSLRMRPLSHTPITSNPGNGPGLETTFETPEGFSQEPAPASTASSKSVPVRPTQECHQRVCNPKSPVSNKRQRPVSTGRSIENPHSGYPSPGPVRTLLHVHPTTRYW
jgi:hypothetical protein